MLIHTPEAFNCLGLCRLENGEWLGKKKKWAMDVEAATSQCNTDISYCETVDWHFEPCWEIRTVL